MQQVRGFVGHEEFWAVGGAQDQRSRGAETRDDDSIFARDFALMEEAADFAAVACGGDGGLHRDRKSVQGAAGCARRVHLPRLRTNTLGIEVGEGVEGGIEAFDLRDVGFGQFHYADVTRAQQFQLPMRGRQHYFAGHIAHGFAAPAAFVLSCGVEISVW